MKDSITQVFKRNERKNIYFDNDLSIEYEQ